MEVKLTRKQKLITAYFAVGILFALYGWMFGVHSSKSFAYNLGQGVFWPVTVFPSLGPVIGGIILVVFIALLLVLF